MIIPNSLYEQYGDLEIISRHYDSAKQWIDYMTRFLTNGIIAKDNYGDWCVPPEDPKLIHSNDPKRQTSGALLATAYFFHDLQLMQRYAKLLGRDDDEQHFGRLALEINAAFNTKFLNRTEGFYDNGTPTSCVLPLAFGLVPSDFQARVFGHLVENITNVTARHIGTGLVGGQWLNRVLADFGRSDLVYTFATNTTYPSWGYMVEQGATTIWELWNGDTADPAMNSGNHVMLVGDLVLWLFEDLAGIKADPEQPGYQHIIMKPQPVGNVSFVKASHRSPYGLIESHWSRTDEDFLWDVTIPANTSATLYIPAASEGSVAESGKTASRAAGLRFLRLKDGCAVYQAGSGRYAFRSRP